MPGVHLGHEDRRLIARRPLTGDVFPTEHFIIMTTTVISDHATTRLDDAVSDGNDLWIGKSSLEAATGWTIKPEGLCNGPVCVPVPATDAGRYVRDNAVNAAAFWRRLDKPVVRSDDGSVWVLGEGAADRMTALQSLDAPDFTLPDLDGAPVSLSNFRGKKVLLASWASW